MTDYKDILPKVGFIAIGRNEGERLQIALKAIKQHYSDSPVVYVDSGSTDNSVEFAASIGVDVVELDMSIPFTAARARNAGFEQLLKQFSDLTYIQFLDGDCEVLSGWVEAGLQTLEDPKIGIASGRRAERYPDASIYNTLMDMEWNSPVGEIMGVPGDILIEVELFKKLEGFNPALIAGEDFDLCLRAKELGFITYRVDAPMSMHDANIMHFSQWYKRAKRGGHAWANLYHIHYHTAAHHFRRKIFGILFYALLLPFALIFFANVRPALAVVLIIGFLLMVSRSVVKRLLAGDAIKLALGYSALSYIAKFPELLGMYEYWKVILRKQRHTLIEYK
ncbi:MAG: glycosyltransferase [Agarilytica sp.]